MAIVDNISMSDTTISVEFFALKNSNTRRMNQATLQTTQSFTAQGHLTFTPLSLHPCSLSLFPPFCAYCSGCCEHERYAGFLGSLDLYLMNTKCLLK